MATLRDSVNGFDPSDGELVEGHDKMELMLAVRVGMLKAGLALDDRHLEQMFLDIRRYPKPVKMVWAVDGSVWNSIKSGYVIVLGEHRYLFLMPGPRVDSWNEHRYGDWYFVRLLVFTGTEHVGGIEYIQECWEVWDPDEDLWYPRRSWEFGCR